jgi:hypothetical protein
MEHFIATNQEKEFQEIYKRMLQDKLKPGYMIMQLLMEFYRHNKEKMKWCLEELKNHSVRMTHPMYYSLIEHYIHFQQKEHVWKLLDHMVKKENIQMSKKIYELIKQMPISKEQDKLFVEEGKVLQWLEEQIKK